MLGFAESDIFWRSPVSVVTEKHELIKYNALAGEIVPKLGGGL